MSISFLFDTQNIPSGSLFITPPTTTTSTSPVKPNWLPFAVIGNGLFFVCVLQMLEGGVSRNTFQVSSGPFTSVLRQPPRLVLSSICRLLGGGPEG